MRARLAVRTTFAALVVIVSSASCVDDGQRMSSGGATEVYEGAVRTEWLRDGRTMKLLEDFTYVDANGTRWKAPKGASVDGASIPRALWWSGGPYEGLYRDASVIHDVYCAEEPRTATWQSVHRMFYEAMLTSGVGKDRALVMYGAVYRHGPRWPAPPGVPAPAGPPPAATVTPLDEDVKRIEELVNSGQVTTPEQVESLPPEIR